MSNSRTHESTNWTAASGDVVIAHYSGQAPIVGVVSIMDCGPVFFAGYCNRAVPIVRITQDAIADFDLTGLQLPVWLREHKDLVLVALQVLREPELQQYAKDEIALINAVFAIAEAKNGDDPRETVISALLRLKQYVDAVQTNIKGDENGTQS